MGSATEQLVPVGIGMIVSPAPFAAVLAVLLSARARTQAAVFTASGIAATAVLIGITAFTATANAAHIEPGAHRARWVFAVITGLAFVVLAALSWRSRAREGGSAVTPPWMARIDTMRTGAAAALGAALALVNAENLPLMLRAGGLIAQAQVRPVQAALSSVGVAVLGGAGLIAVSLLAAVRSEPVAAALAVVRKELIQHNATVMTFVFALLAGIQTAHVVTAALALG